MIQIRSPFTMSLIEREAFIKKNFLLGAVEHLHNCLKAESEVKAISSKVPDLLDDNLSQGFRLIIIKISREAKKHEIQIHDRN
jgi:hypothetical protein